MAAGLYIHAPFCVSKCPYCDFYSVTGWDDALLNAYTERVVDELGRQAHRIGNTADTLYFGGGTPSLLGGKRLARLIAAARERCGLHDAEITLEANPADDLAETLSAFAAAGGNRLSLGMQSASPRELQFLERRHTVASLEKTVADARRAGIENLSLDLMLALKDQTAAEVRASVQACRDYGARHVSAYLLKIEENTPFGQCPPTVPDDDAAAELYLTACEALEQAGFAQYEISNFSKPGYESRHNLKYWNGESYLGIGPAAHSFTEGMRWQYPRSLTAFMEVPSPVPEEESAIACGSPEEYLMLRLRLTEGITEGGFAARFGCEMPVAWRQRAQNLPGHLLIADEQGIRLTREGFLLSSAVIRHLVG